ncbi:hypothetical protein [Parahaliea mediterranea]|uniref:hypothetical protein n=1 Tax=Parahaliea mediterranea TaxID=651086 RepID=UPI000E2FA829|nr:hypothetical protein [Parahaliea mediterranea]
MNKFSIALATLALGSTAAFADCTKPDAPNLPNGASATMEDMLAGQKAVKAFQSANVEYMKCLEEVFTSAEAKVKEGGLAEDVLAETQKTYNDAVEAYNAAVSSEESVAGQFNTEIREYKAANPG